MSRLSLGELESSLESLGIGDQTRLTAAHVAKAAWFSQQLSGFAGMIAIPSLTDNRAE